MNRQAFEVENYGNQYKVDQYSPQYVQNKLREYELKK